MSKVLAVVLETSDELIDISTNLVFMQILQIPSPGIANFHLF